MTNQQSTPEIDSNVSKFIHAPEVSVHLNQKPWKKLVPSFRINQKANQMTGNLLDETLTTVIGTWALTNEPWVNEFNGKTYNAIKLTYKLNSEDTIKTYGAVEPPVRRSSWADWK